GELAVYPQLKGQEAAQVASAFALSDEDFVFPSYRELGVALVRGVDIVEYLHFYRASLHGGGYDPREAKFGMICVPVSSQIPHATGYALGAKLDRRKIVVMTYFGDGGTSQGDFHEGCNFAGVFRLPVVFFCQNNQWAISVPLKQQTAAPIFKKADAYGFPGVRVDGNDVLATYQVTKEAVDRARETNTPTLIEAVTYRMSSHSTADDATRYRTSEEVELLRAFDPLDRYDKFLTNRGLLDEDRRQQFRSEADQLAAYARKGVVGASPIDPLEMFDWVFEKPTEALESQRKEVEEELKFAGETDA
ncbi:MAG: thiamine pyrophosphate-dependent enzyme, partial [Acidimicrobiia bacterium]